MIGGPGIDDHANGVVLFLHEKDPNLAPGSLPEGYEATFGKGEEELDAHRAIRAKLEVPVWLDDLSVTMDVLECFIAEPQRVGLPKNRGNTLRSGCRNFSWLDWPVIPEKLELRPFEAGNSGGTRLDQVTGFEKLVSGLSAITRGRRPMSGNPPQDPVLH